MKKNCSILMVIVFFSTGLCAQWLSKPAIPQAQAGRGGANSFVLNNTFYVIGGYVGFTAGYTADMYAYNPSSSSWTTKTAPTEANRTAGIAGTVNNKAYVGLGSSYYLSLSPSPVYLTDLNEYDAVANTWTAKASFPDSGRVFAASFSLNNKIYVAGGSTKSGVSKQLWEYNPASNTWTQKADMPVALEAATGFASSTKGYLVGGLNSTAIATNKTYEYDPVANTWTTKADMPVTATQGGTAFTIANNAYYVLGSDKDLGMSGSVFSKTVLMYSMNTNTWSTTTYQYPGDGRLWPVSGVINNKAYIGCGYKYASGEFAYKDLYELTLAPSAVKDISTVNVPTVFPNPCMDELYINSESELAVSLFNLQGEVVLSGICSKTKPLYLFDLVPGTYLLETIQGEYKNSQFIQKQ